MSRSRRGPLPGHPSGAARPAPAPGLGGEQPPRVAERHSPRRRRRSWFCCCFRGARPGFGSGSLPRRAAASLFLAPPPPLPPPPLPPPLRPRRGARGLRARDGRRLPQGRLRLRRPRTAQRRQEGPGHPRSVHRLPCHRRRPADSTSPLRPRNQAPSLIRVWASRPGLVPSWRPREIRGERPGAALEWRQGGGLALLAPALSSLPHALRCATPPPGYRSSSTKFTASCLPAWFWRGQPLAGSARPEGPCAAPLPRREAPAMGAPP